MENLTLYIVQGFFFQKWINYIPKESRVVYRSEDLKSDKTFDALEQLCVLMFRTRAKASRVAKGQATLSAKSLVGFSPLY